MSAENLELVRTVYAEWERGQMNAGVELFDPEIVFESFMPDANQKVVANGVDEVASFMREFLTQWRDYRLIGEEFRAIDADSVLVAGRQTATGRLSGVAVEAAIFAIWTFRDGRVVHLAFDRGDRRQALAAAGLRE